MVNYHTIIVLVVCMSDKFSNVDLAQEPKLLTTSEVTTKADFRRALMTLKSIFTDPTDLGTDLSFARFFHSPDLARYCLITDGEQSIGVELIFLHPRLPRVMYTPYAGVIIDYRNQGIYPQMAELIGEHMMACGADHALYEFEDPTRIGTVLDESYPGESEAEVVQRCEDRINFWRRSAGCFVVNDPDVPYCRPAPADFQAVQAYDVLAFRPLNAADPKWAAAFNHDRTAITRGAYEEFYLEIMQIECGRAGDLPTKDALRQQYPAIEQFFRQFEAHPEKQWISLYTDPVRPKHTPDSSYEIRMISRAGLEERMGTRFRRD